MGKVDEYPKAGPFYYYQNKIIAPDEFQKRINPITNIREFDENFIFPGEHRDMWDKYMAIKYPEIKDKYDDHHKALPRGRVDFTNKNNEIEFFITLDKCIINQENQIKKIYNIGPKYSVRFHYGAMNYQCKNCRKK